MGERNDHSGGVSGRAVPIGVALLILVTPAAFYVEIAWNRVYEFSSGAWSVVALVTRGRV